MRTLVFPFTTQDIIVTSPDSISEADWEKISTAIGDLITKTIQTLQPLDPNSPITKLHDSGVGFPVQANDVLWEFLKTAEYYGNLSNGRLNVVSGNKRLDVFTFDQKDLTISRNTNVKIRPHVLMSEWVADKIGQILEDSLVQNYLISAPHNYVVGGEEQWEISFLHPDTEVDIDMVVSGGSAAISYPPITKGVAQEQTATPFSHSSCSVPISAAIIESSSPLYSRAIGELIFDMKAEYQFRKFVSDWKCGATILYADGSFAQYSS